MDELKAVLEKQQSALQSVSVGHDYRSQFHPFNDKYNNLTSYGNFAPS